MTPTKTTEPATTATAALAAATRATAEAFDAISPAGDDLAAARAALEAAEADLLTSVVVKSPDAQAAKKRIEGSRAAVKRAEEELQWRVLMLRAVEVQYEQAIEAEQQARRHVTVEDYEREQARFNDENSRENTLLRQLTDNIHELTVRLADRKDLHERLVSEWHAVPADERPPAKPGQPHLVSTSFRVITAGLNAVPPEILEAIKTGLAAADAEQTERRRAAQFG